MSRTHISASIAAMTIVCALALPAHAGARAKRIVSPFSIHGVSIADTAARVRSRFGPPIRTSYGDGFVASRFVYRNVDIGFDEDGRVVSVVARSTKACFDRSVCLGTSYADALRRLRDIGAVTLDGDAHAQLADGDSGCWLEITNRRGRISALDIRCEP